MFPFLRSTFFTKRVVDAWNKLSEEVVQTMPAFKKQLGTWIVQVCPDIDQNGQVGLG